MDDRAEFEAVVSKEIGEMRWKVQAKWIKYPPHIWRDYSSPKQFYNQAKAEASAARLAKIYPLQREFRAVPFDTLER